jgi:signal peptide peptidase SppA
MRLIDVLTGPWAIMPEKLVEIQEIYRTHLRGEKIDLKAVEAVIGKPLVNEQKPYEVIDGVAVINIEGVLAKKMNWFSSISGGSSTQLIASDFKAAMADEDVQSILLYIDSPGGTVDGNQDLVSLIYQARCEKKKAIIAYTDGCMASAAYWIGAAAGAIYSTNNTAEVGSVGVVASHTDYSKREEQLGIKTTEVYAGKYKRIYSQSKPLDSAGKAYLQDQVDYLKSVFVDSVAEMRGISPLADEDGTFTDWAESKIFIGQQAIDAGLVDGCTTRDALLENMAAGRGFQMTAQASIERDIREQKRRAKHANDSK